MTDLIEPVVPSAPVDFLTGGGEMGALIRSKDWSATPLGPIESWPQSLRTAVSICLNSNFPISLAWGPERIQIYNDGYWPITGDKHPHSMGQDFTECWASAWPVIGDAFDTALAGGRTFLENQRMFLDRYGYLEETFFTFSFSPIRDETGGIGGLFHPVTETTAKMLSERRTRALRDLGRTGKAHSVAEAFALIAEAVSEYDLDLPFVLLYQLDDHGKQARLAASVGVARGTSASPLVIDLNTDATPSPWPFSEIMRSGAPVLVEGLSDTFGLLTCGPYPEPPVAALVVPIMAPGAHGPLGVIVAGVSTRLRLDEAYRDFLDLVGGAVTAAVVNARAYEVERSRAEALAELDRAKTAFFSNVSHEFRTPLTLMLGPVEDSLADDADPLSPRQRDRQELIQRSTLRLLKLVNTLLDFSRIEAGRVEASYQPTDLAALTADLASMFRSAVEKAGLHLVIDTPPLSEPVYVDRDMWEKIVLNLLSNAFKHTFEGDITVALRADAGHARLEVRDTGIGIPAGQVARVFERFHRVPNTRSRTHEGTGIGLSLVQELVRLHGGRADVASEEGSGTVFTVHVPFGTAHLPREQIGAERKGSSTEIGATPFVEEALRWLPARDEANDSSDSTAPVRARIVVADDNADMRDYVTRLLRERGWDVEAVTNGQAALDAARERVPDLVLTDIMMPGLDGLAVLRALKADARTGAVPVVLLSARAGEEARVEGLEAGADDYFVKPFAARELVARVHAHLDRTRDARAERQRLESREQLLGATEAERKRLEGLFLQAPAAIAVLRGPSHVYELANEAYLRIVGNRDVAGKPVREALPEIEGQGIFELLDDVYRTATPFVGDEVRVMLDNARDGTPEEHFFNTVFQPLRDADGAVSGIFVHSVDVTDQVRARQRLEVANEELKVVTAGAEAARVDAEDANRAKGDFLAAMSHELRTPLNAIGGYVQLLNLEIYGPVNAAQRTALARVEKSEQHLLSLINDVLNYAKLEAGRVEFDAEEVVLADVVADVAPMVEPQLQASGVAFEIDVDPAIRAWADREKLQQILLNLLSNAIKFTVRGGTVRVDSPTRAAGDVPPDCVYLRVCDTGVGIARDKQNAIFDPFVQVHRSLTRPTGGTGLGLAISRDLARGMSGDLRVRSVLNEGSTFTVMLPTSQPG